MSNPTQTRLRPWDTLRLVVAAFVSSAKVDPTNSPELAKAQTLMQDVAAQFRAARAAYDRDVASAEALGLPLTPEESIHVNNLLWLLAGRAPIPLKDPPASPTLAAAGALPPLEALPAAPLNDGWTHFKRKGLSEMRPYIPGEDLSDVSVSPQDTPEAGGMIARNPANHADRWYVAKKYFEENLEPASPSTTLPPLEALPAEQAAVTPAPAIPPFQQRVFDERSALVEKIDKLGPFIGSDIWKKLPADEQERLQKQLDVMNEYVEILDERIQNFAPVPALPPLEPIPVEQPPSVPAPTDPNAAPGSLITPTKPATAGMGAQEPNVPVSHETVPQLSETVPPARAPQPPAPVSVPPETARVATPPAPESSSGPVSESSSAADAEPLPAGEVDPNAPVATVAPPTLPGNGPEIELPRVLPAAVVVEPEPSSGHESSSSSAREEPAAEAAK